MRRLLLGSLVAGLLLAGLILALGTTKSEAAVAKEPQLAHMVYFQLTESSPEARKKLVDACKKYLSNHPGTVYFSAGVLADEYKREVNVRDFDVALHLVFQNKGAHDQYQDAPRHKQFIDENKAGWKAVRVFDAFVEP